ncbi:type II/IV secretion system ATPase subunit [Candidatus Bathyarchaeota archaeon]|nr:type II/IV secretion system ATPase subunit [Candidatus Bathyarchaeota archaeon]
MSRERRHDGSQVEHPPTFKEFYPVNPPFGYVGIRVEEETGRLLYLTVEPTLTEEERESLERLKEIIREEAEIPLSVLKDEHRLEEYLVEKARRAMKVFRPRIPEEAVEKFLYYLKRDLLGYGAIDLLMRDENIEDISCDGVRIPIYVWHRRYESLPTNVAYGSEEELDSFILRLAYKAGHQISVSRPILEGTLPEGFRVHLTLEEISRRGPTFTIRKVRTNPFTVVDLIKFGTISTHMAAYFWVLVENLRSIMVCGATASGKTALLNAIATFIRPEMKVVTIEEVRELQLHENWIPMVTRPSFQPGVQEVTLFDLLKASLRQRPDYIIVGEVRGEEAYTLFQSIAVGHGGLCTIHAEDVETVVKRLLTRPMNIPKMMIPLMNVVVLIGRVRLGDIVARRVQRVMEITGIEEKTDRVLFKDVYRWNPKGDNFLSDPELLESGSHVFRKISELRHIPVEDLLEEHRRREIILRWMVKRDIQSYGEVAEVVRRYYLNPGEIYNRARFDLGW